MEQFILRLGWFTFYLGMYGILIGLCCVGAGFMERGKELRGK